MQNFLSVVTGLWQNCLKQTLLEAAVYVKIRHLKDIGKFQENYIGEDLLSVQLQIIGF